LGPEHLERHQSEYNESKKEKTGEHYPAGGQGNLPTKTSAESEKSRDMGPYPAYQGPGRKKKTKK